MLTVNGCIRAGHERQSETEIVIFVVVKYSWDYVYSDGGISISLNAMLYSFEQKLLCNHKVKRER